VTSVKRRQALSLAVVIAGALLLPLGLRAINAALPGAEARSSYLPTLGTPRPREAFDDAAAAALREAQPEFLVIGDSMAGVRIDPRHLSRVTGRSVLAFTCFCSSVCIQSRSGSTTYGPT
jgi:hypothetical protein